MHTESLKLLLPLKTEGTAIVMRERGLLQQALNVFNLHNIRSQALFTQAQIHWKKFLEKEDAQDLQKSIVAFGETI
ncbi:hypothetical protein BGZ83_009416 [Gryganskiella cystojenkinii]|nr:hypothetical protein BGZ83_009416 [Gryganskiella cystojenkinii]